MIVIVVLTAIVTGAVLYYLRIERGLDKYMSEISDDTRRRLTYLHAKKAEGTLSIQEEQELQREFEEYYKKY